MKHWKAKIISISDKLALELPKEVVNALGLQAGMDISVITSGPGVFNLSLEHQPTAKTIDDNDLDQSIEELLESRADLYRRLADSKD
ncbi:MAG: hypothetical protein AAGD01_20260 [Acidobacteriota bacterium]